MQHRYMRKIAPWFVGCLMVLTVSARADIYPMNDGSKIDGDPISVGDTGVVFHLANGDDSARVPWDNFSQDAIRTLLPKIKQPAQRDMVEQLREEPKEARAERTEINVKPITVPPRPRTDLGLTAMFGSPVGLTILFILYGANIFAAYEVARYRRQPMLLVCGLAAIPFLGVLSPIIFVSMPTHKGPMETEMDQAVTRFTETAPPTDAAAVPVVEEAPVAAPEPVAVMAPAPVALPEPIVFKRGDFSFNRRFFETKLAGFLRPVQGEAEKDMVILIKSSRGDFVGRKITNINAAELQLQTFNGTATADERIPFLEILEVQLRHKDLT
jgi:hypothetical protein